MMNDLMNQDVISNPEAIKVGDGATELMWTDRHAYTVVEVQNNGTRLVLQRDTATRTDSNGMSESQNYAYARDPQGEKVVVSRRRNGKFVKVGNDAKNGRRFAIGYRREYYDYSF